MRLVSTAVGHTQVCYVRSKRLKVLVGSAKIDAVTLYAGVE